MYERGGQSWLVLKNGQDMLNGLESKCHYLEALASVCSLGGTIMVIGMSLASFLYLFVTCIGLSDIYSLQQLI